MRCQARFLRGALVPIGAVIGRANALLASSGLGPVDADALLASSGLGPVDADALLAASLGAGDVAWRMHGELVEIGLSEFTPGSLNSNTWRGILGGRAGLREEEAN